MSELELSKDQVLDYSKFIKNLPSIEILLKKLYAIKTIIEERPQLIERLNKPYDIDVLNDIIKNMVGKYSVSLKMYTWPKFYNLSDDELVTLSNTNINADVFNLSKFGPEFINTEVIRRQYPDMDEGMLQDINFFNPNAPPDYFRSPGDATNGGKSYKKKNSYKKKKSSNKRRTNKRKGKRTNRRRTN
jgi:hypothetical protein